MVAPIALKAVAVKHLRAGELATIGTQIYPRPCQAVATSIWVVNNPMTRGIYPDAAVALLEMNHGLNMTVTPRTNFKLAEESPGFKEWHFLIAWCWSLWQAKHRSGDKWSLERRWEAMTAAGYPDSFGAFRTVCSRLKLSVSKSRPIL